MVTIKGGKLKGGTTKKKKHYMDDRKPQQMRAKGSEPGTKRVGPPKKLEGTLNQPNKPKAKPKPKTSKSNSNAIPNKPKAAPKGDSYGGPLMVRSKAKPLTGQTQVKQKPKERELTTIEKATREWKKAPRVQGSDNSRFGYGPYPKTSNGKTSMSINRSTGVGKVLGFIVSGSASRTDEQRKKRARAIRASQK